MDNKNLYTIAYQFTIDNIGEEVLKKTLSTNHSTKLPDSLNAVCKQIISSSKNRAGFKNYVPRPGGDSQDSKILDELLFQYDCKSILFSYSEESLYLKFQEACPNKKVGSSWKTYAKSIISGSQWVSQFATVDDFIKFVDSKKTNTEELAKEIADSVHGLGFALACDFLKESGFESYAKPDVHIKDILLGIGMISEKDDDVSVFKEMVNTASENSISPFLLDKVLRLLGSGNYFGYEKKSLKLKDMFIFHYNKYFR